MMRFGTLKDGTVCAVMEDGGVVSLSEITGSMIDLITYFDSYAPEIKARLGETSAEPASSPSWAAPIPTPQRNIFCVGKNYSDHANEIPATALDAASSGCGLPEAPIIFTKVPEAVIGPDADIIAPKELTQKVDYEAEIAVIIGKPGRFIAEENAMDHVFGYTLLNDVTARDLQQKHKQWFLGKGIETFCPMGPLITTRDEVDLESLEISCVVNGEERQSGIAKDMIFDVPTVIATLSRSFTLKPGDIVATGTPAGVGAGMTPPQFLNDGDIVEVKSPQLGTLRNTVRVV